MSPAKSPCAFNLRQPPFPLPSIPAIYERSMIFITITDITEKYFLTEKQAHVFDRWSRGLITWTLSKTHAIAYDKSLKGYISFTPTQYRQIKEALYLHRQEQEQYNQ